LSAEQHAFDAPRFSPDGNSVAVTVESGIDSDIWLLDIARQTFNRLTFNGGAQYPSWTPQGRHIIHSGRAPGGQVLFRQPVSGGASSEPLFESNAADVWESVVSPDGRRLVVRTTPRGEGTRDIAMVDLERPSAQRSILATTSDEHSPVLSADGRWLAYVSDESGRSEVYVRRFPEGPSRWQISADGGTEPLWSPDGRELFYRSGNSVIAVDVSVEPARRTLFQGVYTANPTHTNYDIHPDGTRFVFVQPGRLQFLVVILDWDAALTDGGARRTR
jgi:Tol biopolymer transport system component